MTSIRLHLTKLLLVMMAASSLGWVFGNLVFPLLFFGSTTAILSTLLQGVFFGFFFSIFMGLFFIVPFMAPKQIEWNDQTIRLSWYGSQIQEFSWRELESYRLPKFGGACRLKYNDEKILMISSCAYTKKNWRAFTTAVQAHEPLDLIKD